jgi:hypothetical protein
MGDEIGKRERALLDNHRILIAALAALDELDEAHVAETLLKLEPSFRIGVFARRQRSGIAT